MNDTDIEGRLARLERQAALWKVVALGGAALSGAMITNACGTKTAQAPAPSSLELKGANGEVNVTSSAITLQRGDARIVLEPGTITLVAGDKTTTLTPAQLIAEAGGAKLTLGPGQLELANAAHQIVGRLGSEGPTFELKNGAQAVQLAAFTNVSSVSADTTIESPTESIRASLLSDARGATATVALIGETKSLEVRKPAAPVK